MNSFDVHDTILYPLTYNDLVLMAQNINPASGRTLRGELETLLREKSEEALALFDENEEHIYAEAFPERVRAENPLGEEKTERLAQEIYKLLIEYRAWVDTCIYYNGKRMSTCRRTENGWEFRYNGEPFYDEAEPRDFFEYAGPILSMSFEGPLYDAINYGTMESLKVRLQELFERFGVYYELGNSWNFSVYPI